MHEPACLSRCKQEVGGAALDQLQVFKWSISKQQLWQIETPEFSKFSTGARTWLCCLLLPAWDLIWSQVFMFCAKLGNMRCGDLWDVIVMRMLMVRGKQKVLQQATWGRCCQWLHQSRAFSSKLTMGVTAVKKLEGSGFSYGPQGFPGWSLNILS